jgi:oligoendopeptidase F
MRTKARLHGHDGALPWWDLFAPLPVRTGGDLVGRRHRLVRNAFASYGGRSPGSSTVRSTSVDRRRGRATARSAGRSACRSSTTARSCCPELERLVDSAQTTAHELGHAYHNTQLAHRTPLQRQLPMALAETASIFCETLVVEAGLRAPAGRRPAGTARRRSAGLEPGGRRHPLSGSCSRPRCSRGASAAPSAQVSCTS